QFKPGKDIETGFEGVSFDVRPQVSPDRRYLRLNIHQTTNQLIAIAKTKVFDATTGKDTETESPDVRKSTRSATVQILDGAPILMPVDYRPPGKGNETRIWVVISRPLIWIEAEAKERGPQFKPKSVWDSELPKDELEKPDSRPPQNDETKEILQAVVKDVLTNPGLAEFRKFFTEKDP